MSRVITYLTNRASDANDHIRMARAMLLMMDMIMKGMASVGNYGIGSYSIGNEARANMDYALESPDEIPAGGCEQYEIETGDEDNGFPGYCVFAQQITVRREEL